jgi:hypothetical protein
MARNGFHRRAYLRKVENEPPARPKSRLCLKCRAPFASGWAGERVCAKCKSTSVWRDGVAANMASWSR